MQDRTGERQRDPRFKIGMRNVKTAFSVGICILFFQFIGIGDGIQAAIAAIICMKSSLQNSIQTGIERLIGTIIGSVLGILSLILIENMSYNIVTMLAISGVVLIIYLCNIFKVQASIVIGLVVFLIILIGEKDTPPILYGILRLSETIFGILVAYLVNRFFDPRHIRNRMKEKIVSTQTIRPSTDEDLAKIMAVWLSSNLYYHNFIDASYWHSAYDSVRNSYKNNEYIYIYETNDKILGYISLSSGAEIDSLHSSTEMHDAGIEEELLRHCQDRFPCLTSRVFVNNAKIIEIYLKTGFYIVKESLNEPTSAYQYEMAWSNKS